MIVDTFHYGEIQADFLYSNLSMDNLNFTVYGWMNGVMQPGVRRWTTLNMTQVRYIGVLSEQLHDAQNSCLKQLTI